MKPQQKLPASPEQQVMLPWVVHDEAAAQNGGGGVQGAASSMGGAPPQQGETYIPPGPHPDAVHAPL